MATREVLEGEQPQGEDEAISYHVLCDPAAVEALAVKVYDETNGGEDVTAATLTAGTATVSGGNIILPLLQNLSAGHLYRVEVRYSDGTNTLEPYFQVRAER